MISGYRKQNIKIEINEDGTLIIIRGEKVIQETLMVGWILLKKGTEKREFKKAFKIPDGVILDEIKAKFNDDEYILTISIPKKVKGIRGHSIEEVKEPEITREGSGTLQIVPDEVPKGENVLDATKAEYVEEIGLSEGNVPKLPEIPIVQEPEESGSNVANPEETKVAEVLSVKQKMKEIQEDQNERLQKASSGQQDLVKPDTIEEIENFPGESGGEATAKAPVVESEKQETSQRSEGKTEEEHDKRLHLEQEIDQYQHKNDQHDPKENDFQEDKEDESALVNPADKAEPQEGMPSSTEEERGKCKICIPILAGSAVLLSLVVFVIHFIRTKGQPGKRKD